MIAGQNAVLPLRWRIAKSWRASMPSCGRRSTTTPIKWRIESVASWSPSFGERCAADPACVFPKTAAWRCPSSARSWSLAWGRRPRALVGSGAVAMWILAGSDAGSRATRLTLRWRDAGSGRGQAAADLGSAPVVAPVDAPPTAVVDAGTADPPRVCG